MKLFNIQNKLIESKPTKYSLVKGKSNTGKSEAILHRMLNIVNNFAYEEDDNILVLQKERRMCESLLNRYEKVKFNNEFKYLSLLSSNKSPEFTCLRDIIDKYSSNNNIVTVKQKEDIIEELLNEFNFKKCKKLISQNMYVILSEIKYMKNNRITCESEFMTLMGGPLRLRKNSPARCDMFKLFTMYNDKLKELSLVDDEDRVIEAIKFMENNKNGKYVHIFADNVESLSKIELELLLSMHKEKTYGTVTLSVDVDKNENIYSSLVKKGRVYAKKTLGDNKKIFNFKMDVNERKANKPMFLKENKVLEKFMFIDLKHRVNFDFSLEDNGHEVSFVGEEKFKKDELKAVPVFNNIAAGEPILINPTQEDVFSLPKYWVKGSENKFILKIKGDSMIDANIFDEDLVVIEQNNSPVNGDIVAVNIDGSATLKRFKREKGRVLLMPENKRYAPIEVTKDQEFFVLGKAVGIIKKK